MDGRIPNRNPDMVEINRLQAKIEALEALEIAKRKKRRLNFSGIMGRVNPKDYPWNL